MPKTRHAWPRTVAQLRPKDSKALAPPTTISGTISDRNVSRISPGTMISANPTPMAMLAKIRGDGDAAEERHRRV